jgi:hypothetical protein
MIISISVVVILYLVYRYFFKFYAIVDKMPQGLRNKLRRGKCPPSYPNGWYRLARADELQPGYYSHNLVSSTKLNFLEDILYTIEDTIKLYMHSMLTVHIWELIWVLEDQLKIQDV